MQRWFINVNVILFIYIYPINFSLMYLAEFLYIFFFTLDSSKKKKLKKKLIKN